MGECDGVFLGGGEFGVVGQGGGGVDAEEEGGSCHGCGGELVGGVVERGGVGGWGGRKGDVASKVVGWDLRHSVEEDA